MSDSLDSRLPVTVFSGFLGAGKTTLVNRILNDPKAPSCAVVVNEFGDVGIDGALVVASDEEVIELANGCVCCTVRGDLVAAVASLLDRAKGGFLRSSVPFERLLIETSGLASPGPVVQTLLVESQLSQALGTADVVTLCNAEHIGDQLKKFSEAREQVGYADCLLLNHCDRVTPAACDTAEDLLRSVNALGLIQRSEQAQVDLDLVLGEFDHDRIQAPPEISQEHSHSGGAGTVILRADSPLSLHTLKIWLRFLSKRRTHELWRIKGIVRCKEVSNRVVVQGVYQHLTIGPDPEPAPTESVIVLIGRELDQAELERGWASVAGA